VAAQVPEGAEGADCCEGGPMGLGSPVGHCGLAAADMWQATDRAGAISRGMTCPSGRDGWLEGDAEAGRHGMDGGVQDAHTPGSAAVPRDHANRPVHCVGGHGGAGWYRGASRAGTYTTWRSSSCSSTSDWL
jgi:hypothetical protein